jgi:hypothetical protein
MRIRARRLPSSVRLGLCVLCVHLFSALSCLAQGQQFSFSFAQGTHFFRRVLADRDLRPLHDLEQLQEEPEKKILIVLGETEKLQRGFDLEEFVRRGGAVLLATDRDCTGPLRRFGIRVVGARVSVAVPRFAYKQSSDCIFIERYPQSGNREVPVFENLSFEGDLSRIATNRPGYLAREGRLQLPVLATFPPGCWTSDGHNVPFRLPARNHQAWLNASNAILPFAVGGTWGQGRILVLSDHSVFINEMMWQRDIENIDFAYNCVDWLTNGGQRTEVLFLEEGQVQQSFEVPLKVPPPPPLPPVKTLVETADKAFGELERDNAFNRAIHGAVREMAGLPDRWNRGVIITSTVALALLGLTRLSQARNRKEDAAPPAASGGTPVPRARSLFEQRQQAMVREGNFWEPARALARQGIESALGSRFQIQQHLSAAASGSPPALSLQGNWWRRWRFRRRFQRLWRLAYGSEPVRISSRRLRRLGREIENLNTALIRLDLPHRRPQRNGEDAQANPSSGARPRRGEMLRGP